jgi:hypothetical protein
VSWQAMDAIDQLPYDACGQLAFRVLTKLANVAAQDGTRAYRSKHDMARELGVNVRSVQRALAELTEGHLIRKGDQRHVSHIRADRRPTVYDINMGAAATVQIVLPDGETEFSTGDDDNLYGETHGGVIDVAHRELRELTTSTTRDNHTVPVSPSASLRCTAPGQRSHRFDSLSGWCPCGVRSDALTGGTR